MQRNIEGFFLLFAAFTLISLTAPAIQAQTDQAEEKGLPIHLTDEELTRIDEIGLEQILTPPPAVPVRQCAEWEPVTGVIVRYDMGFGLPYEILAEYSEDLIVYVVLIEDQESNAYNAMSNGGVNMANVEFIFAATNSIWTRDYGPQFIFADGVWGIVDHIYNRPRPDDDLVNWVLGTEWSADVYGTDLLHTGGNYMADGHGKGFSTELVWDENLTLTHEQIEQYMEDYLGITEYVVVPDIAPDGIHHIDCWAKLLNEETIMVKEVASDHPHYDALEANVDYLETLTNCYGRPYNVVRVFCGQLRKDDVAAYTNSIILNDKVFVPTFDISTDEAALDAYRAAMPGYEVLGYEGSWLDDDAIHCRAMGVHDRHMLIVDTDPLQDLESNRNGYRVTALIDDRSEAGLVGDSLLVFWRLSGEEDFNAVALQAILSTDSFEAYIPMQPEDSNVEYYVLAKDMSGRRRTRPVSSPNAFYSFYTGEDNVTGAETPSGTFALEQNYPNPFNPSTIIRFSLPATDQTTLAVFDVNGREVARLVDGVREKGSHTVEWIGISSNGRRVESGIYFYSLRSGSLHETRKMILIR
ncbi:MAG: agmatine deiminase family protein [Candidatus Krumholzibacteriota bacterium]|nr:agmatine deiminase family protein [Candidatus Krumholzibacteriota bacterium]